MSQSCNEIMHVSEACVGGGRNTRREGGRHSRQNSFGFTARRREGVGMLARSPQAALQRLFDEVGSVDQVGIEERVAKYGTRSIKKAAKVQGLKLAGADMIIGVDLNPARKDWGERFGMTHFVNPKEVGDDIVPYLVNMTKRGADQIGGADYTFDCTGNTKVMRQALEASHRGWGKSVVIGVAGAGQEISTRPFQLVTGRSWMGTAFGGARGRTDVPKIVDWYMEGKIEIDPMITHTLALEDINKGF
eukprot:gene3267-4210_t